MASVSIKRTYSAPSLASYPVNCAESFMYRSANSMTCRVVGMFALILFFFGALTEMLDAQSIMFGDIIHEDVAKHDILVDRR